MASRLRLWLTMTVLALSTAACTPTVPRPEATPTPTPVATVAVGDLVKPGHLMVCSSLDHTPQDMLSGDTPAGSDIDIARAIAQRLGLELDVVRTDAGAIGSNLTNHSCDLAISAIRSSSDQAKGFAAVPYLQITDVVVQRKGATPMSIQNDLCGHKIGSLAGTDEAASLGGTGSYAGRGLSQACQQSGHADISAPTFAQITDALAALTDGSVDALLVDSALAGYLTQQHGDELFSTQGATMTVDTETMLMLPGATSLRSAVDTALQSIERDGTYATILLKYGIAAAAGS
jgi:polar amino acid transport system substrate-binding protein